MDELLNEVRGRFSCSRLDVLLEVDVRDVDVSHDCTSDKSDDGEEVKTVVEIDLAIELDADGYACDGHQESNSEHEANPGLVIVRRSPSSIRGHKDLP